jgi:hypothetical protein
MASREFAKAASFVVDAEFKVVARARLDEIVDEIFRKFFLMAFCSLLAQQSLILRRHEFTPRGKTFRLGHGEQLRLVGFSLDFADHGQRHTVSPEHSADGHKADETYEEIAHATCRASDIGHLGEHDFEFVHHLLPDPVNIGETRALAQHRFGKVEALAHGGLHCTAMLLVKGMDDLSHCTPL